MKLSAHRMRSCALSPSQQIEHTTLLLILQMVLFWIFGMHAYSEKFRFWEYAVSYLGALRTVNGHANTPSLIWFVTSMLISAWFMHRMSVLNKNRQIVNGSIYQVLYTMGWIGSLIICCPKDISRPVHAMGAGLLVFSHVMLSLVRILAQGRLMKTHSTVTRLLLLLVPVLLYAYCWAFWIESVVQVFQKLAFAALFYVEIITTRERLVSREERIFSLTPSHSPPSDNRILGSR